MHAAGQTPLLRRGSVELLEQLGLGARPQARNAAEVGRRASLGEAEGLRQEVLMAEEALVALAVAEQGALD